MSSRTFTSCADLDWGRGAPDLHYPVGKISILLNSHNRITKKKGLGLPLANKIISRTLLPFLKKMAGSVHERVPYISLLPGENPTIVINVL